MGLLAGEARPPRAAGRRRVRAAVRVFSMAGGFFADRFSKRNVAIAVKCAELGIMSAASRSACGSTTIPLMLAGIFLMSTHSAIFGPTKYGMLPELLPEKKLSWGNGILRPRHLFRRHHGGTILAGWLSRHFRQTARSGPASSSSRWRLSDCALCLGVTRAARRRPAQKIPREFPRRFLVAIQGHPPRPRFVSRRRWQHVSFLSSPMLLQLIVVFYGKDIFHFDDRHEQLFAGRHCSSASAPGSLAAGFLSGGKIEYGLIPLGHGGLTDFLADCSPMPGLVVRRFRAGPRPAGFLRRILQRARQRHHPTPPRRRQQRQAYCRRRAC